MNYTKHLDFHLNLTNQMIEFILPIHTPTHSLGWGTFLMIFARIQNKDSTNNIILLIDTFHVEDSVKLYVITSVKWYL